MLKKDVLSLNADNRPYVMFPFTIKDEIHFLIWVSFGLSVCMRGGGLSGVKIKVYVRLGERSG